MDFGLQPKERGLLDLMESSSSQFIGYGGARGGAKSHALRACFIIRRLRHPGTNGVIFRRTSPLLWETHIAKMMAEWPDLYRDYWSEKHNALMLPGNSTLLFRYADTLQDIMEFRGREYGDLGIDEATDQTEQELAILFSCCRSTVSGFVPKRVLTFNPGGVGHAYVKRLFIDRLTTPEEAALNPAFIQAYAWDNIMWVRDALARDRIAHQEYRAWPDDKRAEYLIRNSDYGKTLNALPADLRDAWLWGRWDIFAGQFFDCFRPDKHVEEMVEERAA